jgi:hypothetical protein
MSTRAHFLLGAFLVVNAGCAAATPPPSAPITSAPAAPAAAAPSGPAVPAALHGMAVLVAATEADYARAELASAVKPAGEGGLTHGLVVRLTRDVSVWRMWSGPAKRDDRGNTNRMGQWWSYDAPRGNQQGYRQSYEICVSWNELTWVAKCTLKKGAVVAVGPGNSVTPKTCGDASGKEAYPVNERDWQLWLSKAWTRAGADKEIDCPAESADYEADPADIARTKGGAAGK